jgi:hypothetical protein
MARERHRRRLLITHPDARLRPDHPFGVWDDCTRGFVTKPGEYTVYVGNSADNTPHRAALTAG